jgi:hypothetical protein
MKIIILTTLLACVSVSVAQAACDTKSLKGSYTLAGNVFNNGSNCALVGIATFDGKGNLKMRNYEGCGDDAQLSTTEFSYNLDAFCMGSATNSISGINSYFVFNKLLSNGSIFISANGIVAVSTMNKQ